MPTPYFAHLHLPHDTGLLPEIRIYRRTPRPHDTGGPLTELPFLPADGADPRAVAVTALADAGWAPAGEWTPVANGAELDLRVSDPDLVLADAAEAARVAAAHARRTVEERDHLIALVAQEYTTARIAEAVELPAGQVRRIADTPGT